MPKPARPDRRINRTRENLFKAASELMLEKRYDDITIQDVIDRANVGRSTFYAHFQDKEDLAQGMLHHILDKLAAAMDEDPHNPQEGLLPGVQMFEHIREHYPMFKAMTSGRGLDLFFQKGYEYWSVRMISRLEAMLPAGKTPRVPIPILANHISGTYINLLKWWIDQKMPCSAERMTEIARTLLLPSIQAGLE